MMDIAAPAKPSAPKTITTKHLAGLRSRRAASPRQEAEFGNDGRTHRDDHQASKEGGAGKDRRARNSASAASCCPHGPHPATGETIHIKAKKKVAFRASKELKTAI
jgi:DNA-binding protein HU-beta